MIIVAGIPTGAVVVGIGSRVAMLLLRLTSPQHVHGVISDDGFVIGRFTVGGSYNLLQIGAVAGIIGALAYRMVSPWLLGPVWLRRLTTGLASGLVAGSALIHPNGVDFTRLKPTWFAIGLFVALPFAFGLLIGAAVDAARQPDSRTVHGRRRWLLPLIAIICFPITILFLVFASAIVVFTTWMRDQAGVQAVRASRPYGLVVRTGWLAVAVAGLVALVNDITALA